VNGRESRLNKMKFVSDVTVDLEMVDLEDASVELSQDSRRVEVS